jgi:GNAT superfamily N-acetyltransferase
MDYQMPRTPTPSSSSASGAEAGLRRVTEADVKALSNVLADAFYDDPIYSWLLPDDSTRHASLRRFFALELRIFGLDRGVAWTTTEPAGTAISTPPGRWRLPPAAAMKNFRRYRAVFGSPKVAVTAVRYLFKIEKHHLREAHHYIVAVGVAPASQGQGLGTRLLGPTLAACDEAGVPGYIEASSERNRALYERLGFLTTEELFFADSPPLWLMRREPGATGPADPEVRPR